MSIHRSQLKLAAAVLGDHEALCAAIVADHQRQEYTAGNNFALSAPIYSDFCAGLYTEFVTECRKRLGRFEIAPQSKSTCWAYVSNRASYRGGIHHHLRTSTINGVYYLNVPKCEPGVRYTGALLFFDANSVPMMRFQVRQGDLLMFPNYLLHEPEPIESDAFRIAINMEILCSYVWRP